MRLLTRKLWRAFPELDAFDDERCARFIGVARRSIRASIARWTVYICIAAAIAYLCALSMLALFDALVSRQGKTWWADLALALVPVPFAIVGFLAGLIARDLLLRRRVRSILSARSRCPGCSYSLLGLPVSDELIVHCPECGHEMRVDASLAELVSDESGTKRFKPQPEHRRSRWLTLRRALLAAKVLFALVLAAGLYLGIRWAAREIRLHSDARQALADIVGLRPIQELTESTNPAADGSIDGWVRFEEAVALIQQAEQQVAGGPDAIMDPDREQPERPDYTQVSTTPSRMPERNSGEWGVRATEVARRCLAAMRTNGTLDALKTMADSPRAVRQWQMRTVNGQQSLALTNLSDSRTVVKICCALARQALDRGDQDAFVEHLRQGAWVSRALMREPTLMSRLVGISAGKMVDDSIANALFGDAPAGLAQRLHTSVVPVLQESPPISLVLRGHRTDVLDDLARTYADIEGVRKGFEPFTFGIAGFSSTIDMTVPAMKYRQTRLELEPILNAMVAIADHPRHLRDLSPLNGPFGCPYIESMVTPLRLVFDSMDEAATIRTATFALIAIHRYRDDRGDYPAGLADLVPSYLADIPDDPACSTKFRYKRIDAAADRHKRGYLLYSISADGKDDGGLENRFFMSHTLYKKYVEPIDVIFNHPER